MRRESEGKEKRKRNTHTNERVNRADTIRENEKLLNYTNYLGIFYQIRVICI